jgi:uncharacterized membrane protein
MARFGPSEVLLAREGKDVPIGVVDEAIVIAVVFAVVVDLQYIS